jgi:predicted dehydrogenase
MAQATYRAGIVGLGFIGGGDQVSGDRIGQQVANLDGHHREALSRNKRIELVAGCDVDAGRRERFAERTGARTYFDWQEMYEKEHLDLVSIATSAPGHAPLTAAAARRGIKAIYCEKPIAVSLNEADEMLSTCDAAGALLVVNHNRRFDTRYRRLRARIAEGALGELTGVSARWGAGRLGCTGTHFFDAIRMLTGREFRAVSATLDLTEKVDCRGPEFQDPGGWGVLRMGGDLMAVVNGANYAAGPARMTIEGTRGMAVIAGREIFLEWYNGNREPSPGREAGETSMDQAVREIIEWLDGRRPFPHDPWDAVHAFEAVVGFHASHRRNAAWTEFPLSGADRAIEVLSG